MPLGQFMQRLSSKILLGNLTFEFDTMSSVPRHDLHFVEARLYGQLQKRILFDLGTAPLRVSGSVSGESVCCTLIGYMPRFLIQYGVPNIGGRLI